jgi:hypothetical protein
VAYSGHEQEGLFQFLQSRPCTKQNNVVCTVMRPQRQMPHAALTREVFILTNDKHDVSGVSMILALCVVVTEVTATSVLRKHKRQTDDEKHTKEAHYKCHTNTEVTHKHRLSE